MAVSAWARLYSPHSCRGQAPAGEHSREEERREKRQFVEQEPGPRGSPQLPQDPGDASEAAAPFPLLTAKTESCFSSFTLSHDGHRGVSSEELNTSVSNRLLHSKQAYSNMGMTDGYYNAK